MPLEITYQQFIYVFYDSMSCVFANDWKPFKCLLCFSHQDIYKSNVNYLIFLILGDNENDNEDGDLIVTQQEVNLIDPISMKRMTDPVRNKICGHVYERSSVVKMIKQSKRKGFR